MTTEQNTNQQPEQDTRIMVYYWGDAYWTIDPDERQMADDWDLYGGAAEMRLLPAGLTDEQISERIAELISNNQPHAEHPTQPHADTPRVGSEHPARGVCGSDNDIPH